MKIALIAPPYPLEEIPSPPLGLTYIAAVCEDAGAQVVILDYIVRGYSPDKLKMELAAVGPDIVGTNSVTMNFKQSAEMLRVVKQTDPDIITLMGGPHVSFDSDNTLLQNPQIDIIVKGEGEATVTALLKVIHNRDRWHEISGIAFKAGDRIITTAPRPLIADLDLLPRPARHLLPMARYQALGYPVSIITSRGCPNQCIFCLGRRMVGHKVRFRSAVRIVDEMAELVSEGSAYINIADDLFTADKKRVKQLCDEIARRNLAVSWSAFSRVNTIDTKTLKQMKQAGCHSVSFGIESGNPDMLRRVKKGITIAQVKKASQACREAGIRGHASFMVGLPGETRQTLADSLKLQDELEIESAYHFLAPFPGTTVRENIASYDLEILTHDWDLYNANQSIVRTRGLSPEEMDAFVYDAGAKMRQEWDVLTQKYRNRTATPFEQMQVGGRYRTEMIFALLSQDVLENSDRNCIDREAAITRLTEQISRITGFEKDFIAFTLKDLIARGYLQVDDTPGKTGIAWGHHKPVLKK